MLNKDLMRQCNSWLNKPFFSWVALFILGVIDAALFFKIHGVELMRGAVPLWDFDIYWRICRDVWSGHNPYQLDYMQIAGPPLMVLPFFPFALFALPAARSLFFVLSWLAGWGTALVLAGKIAPKKVLLVGLLIHIGLLLAFPTRFNFVVGQPNLLMAWVIALLITGTRFKVQIWGTVLLMLIKSNYVVLLTVLLKKWHQLLIAVVMLASIAVLALPVLKIEWYVAFLQQRVQAVVVSAPATTDVDYYNQSLRATMARMQWNGAYQTVAVLLLGLGVMLTVYYKDAMLAVLVSLLLSPIVWQHYLVITYPILIMMGWMFLRTKKITATGLWWLCAALLLLGHLPALHGQAAIFPSNVLASHFFVGLIVLTAVRWKQLAAHDEAN